MAQIDVITLALAKKFAGGFDPTDEQLAAINSGIDSEKVVQITRNKDNITGLTNDLHNHYYTQNEVMSLIASARAVLQVAALPASPANNTIYYVGTTSPYHVYLYDSVGQQVDLGTSEIDLTQYYTKTETDTLLDDKQDTLVSGTNIKTINNQSLLGSGNIDIPTIQTVKTMNVTGARTDGAAFLKDSSLKPFALPTGATLIGLRINNPTTAMRNGGMAMTFLQNPVTNIPNGWAIKLTDWNETKYANVTGLNVELIYV